MSHRPVSITSRLVQLTDTWLTTGPCVTTGLELGELTGPCVTTGYYCAAINAVKPLGGRDHRGLVTTGNLGTIRP